MKKNIEIIDSKKEYEAPQMEVLALEVQGALLDCSGTDCSLDVIIE